MLLSNGNWSAPAYGGNYLKTKTKRWFSVTKEEERRGDKPAETWLRTGETRLLFVFSMLMEHLQLQDKFVAIAKILNILICCSMLHYISDNDHENVGF